MVSYEKDTGAILHWSGGYSGTIDYSINNYLNFNTLENTGNMDNNAAYFSNQTFRIGAKTCLLYTSLKKRVEDAGAQFIAITPPPYMADTPEKDAALSLIHI